jgi:hypothetical protein
VEAERHSGRRPSRRIESLVSVAASALLTVALPLARSASPKAETGDSHDRPEVAARRVVAGGDVVGAARSNQQGVDVRLASGGDLEQTSAQHFVREGQQTHLSSSDGSATIVDQDKESMVRHTPDAALHEHQQETRPPCEATNLLFSVADCCKGVVARISQTEPTVRSALVLIGGIAEASEERAVRTRDCIALRQSKLVVGRRH